LITALITTFAAVCGNVFLTTIAHANAAEEGLFILYSRLIGLQQATDSMCRIWIQFDSGAGSR
jgi:hypothetical protein